MPDKTLAFRVKDKAYVFHGISDVNDSNPSITFLPEINRLSDQLMINFARADLPHSDEIEDFFSNIAMKDIEERTDEESHFLSRIFSNPHYSEKHANNLYVLRLQAFRILAAGAASLENKSLEVTKLPKSYKPFEA